MTLWLTAMLVWVAAGARVGRVLVKPATTARVAIVVAVAAVAVAATIAVPEIALALDNLLPRGLHSGMLSDGVVTSAWILFSTATSVVASAAWPVVSRTNLRQIAFVIYGLGVLAVAVNLFWSTTFGWIIVALGCVFVVITGVRNLDWTTLGRGIAIYTAGTAVIAVLAVLQVRRACADASPTKAGEPDWGWPIWEAAALLIAFGAVWSCGCARESCCGRSRYCTTSWSAGFRRWSLTNRRVPRRSSRHPTRLRRSWTRCICNPAAASNWSPRVRHRHWYRRVRTALRNGRETLWAMS
jgi:hypothetical protein